MATRRDPSERTPLLSRAVDNDAAAQENALTGNAAVEQPSTIARKSVRQIGPDMLRGVLMMFMAIDHVSVVMGGYAHGQGVVSEAASTIVTQWNGNWPYFLRSLSHLCAPGFSMLMGMGLAYWSRSRIARGEPLGALSKHIVCRGGAMIVLNYFTIPWILLQGVWLLNMVMWALAIDYILVGFFAVFLQLWLEPRLAKLLKSEKSSDTQATSRAALFIDLLLVALSAVLIWVNIWTAPNQGECLVEAATPGAHMHELVLALTAKEGNSSPWTQTCKAEPRLIYDFFFHQVTCINLGVISGFPPIGWLGFVVFGLAYGRFLSRSKLSEGKTIAFNASLAVGFAVLFVLTRVLGFGNLSTHCLRTADQLAQKLGSNQFLASLKSFLYGVKYPPSPAYAFGTLSVSYVLLCLLDLLSLLGGAVVLFVQRNLLILGTNALFFYAFHMMLISTLGSWLATTSLAHDLPPWSRTGRGFGLGIYFWIFYAFVLVVSLFACKAFAKFKASRGPESVFRFF